jgi:hypothetical protein
MTETRWTSNILLTVLREGNFSRRKFQTPVNLFAERAVRAKGIISGSFD